MNRVGMNIVLGTFWILVGIWMFLSGGSENQLSAAVLIILGLMFYWAAYKIYLNPNLQKKNKKNLVQKMTDPSAKSSYKNSFKGNLKNIKKK